MDIDGSYGNDRTSTAALHQLVQEAGSSSSDVCHVLQYRIGAQESPTTQASIVCIVDAAVSHLLPRTGSVLPPLTEPAELPVAVERNAEKGATLLAARALQRGDTILEERPLFLLHRSLEQSLDIHAAIVEELLPSRQQAVFFGLDDGGLTSGRDPLQAIYDTNAHSISIAGSSHSAIFDLSSRLSHSCSPNAVHRFDPTRLAFTLTAMRDIPRGAEVTISYYPLDVLLLPRDDRRSAVAEHRGFVCACEVCRQGDAQASNDRRQRIQRLSIALFAKAGYTEADLGTVSEIMRLHEEEGLLTGLATLSRLAVSICSQSDVTGPVLREWTERAVSELSVRYGPDSPEVQDTRALAP